MIFASMNLSPYIKIPNLLRFSLPSFPPYPVDSPLKKALTYPFPPSPFPRYPVVSPLNRHSMVLSLERDINLRERGRGKRKEGVRSRSMVRGKTEMRSFGGGGGGSVVYDAAGADEGDRWSMMLPELMREIIETSMGLFSNRISRESLKPGDHIYSWRTAYVYAHQAHRALVDQRLTAAEALKGLSEMADP